MPETATFQGTATPTKVNWLYVGGGIFGLIGVMYLITRKSSGSPGTVAAGSSINAALGSLQEAALNQQGAQSLAQASLDTIGGGQDTIATTVGQINNNVGQIGTTLTGVQTGITGIQSSVNDINTHLSSEENLLQNLGAAQATMSQQLGTNSASVQSLNTMITNLEQQMNSGFQSMGAEAQSILSKIQQGASITAGQLSTLSGNILFSRADNTRYLVQPTGLFQLNYAQEKALTGAGAQIMYVNPSLSQFKIGGAGD